MDDPTPTVFVVDDDASVRAALTGLLRSLALDVRCFASAREFLDTPPIDVPACVILGVNLPGLSGLDAQNELAERKPQLPIIFITGHGDIPMSVQAMKAGAVEFLSKPFDDQQLIDAVWEGLRRARQARRAYAESTQLQRCFDSLTPRQRQVMVLVVEGRLNKQIASNLKISEVTVKIHRRQMMRKMHAGCVADLVRMGERLSLGPGGP